MQRFPLARFIGARLRRGSARPRARPASSPPPATLLDRVAAVVNDGIVLQSELDEQVVLITERLREQKLDLPPENVLRQQVLERLVLQEIQMQRADAAGPQGAGRGAEQRHARKSPSATTSRCRSCPRRCRRRASTTPSYRDAMRKELTLSLLRQRDVIQRISVTPREIDQYLERAEERARRNPPNTTSRTS